MASFDDYADHDAVSLAALVRGKEVHPRELVEAAIARAERLNPRLNAIITRMYDEAREVADRPIEGPLAGVPFVVKDLGPAVKGQPFTRGSRLCAQHVADHDGELVKRYRAAGLVLIGKTNTPEFGLTPVTEPEIHGATDNPWQSGITAGGSSGGSAAAVAAGIVPAGHANDGGGSIRIPASCCGLFGLKPTRARVPTGPDVSEGWYGFSIDHVVTRSVRDSAALLDVSHGPEVGAPYAAPAPSGPFSAEVDRDPGRLRIALSTEPWLPSKPEPAVIAAAERCAALCEELGHEVVIATPPLSFEALAIDFTKLISVATACDLVELGEVVGQRATRHDVELDTWLTARAGDELGAVEIELARRRLMGEARAMHRFMQDFDAVLTPTLGMAPVPHGALRPPPLEQQVRALIAKARLSPMLRLPGLMEHAAKNIYQFIPWTPIANVTGQPAMSVPLSVSDAGLPLGVMFTGRFGDEATLLRLAGQLERARPWHDRRPG
jgi:amidase